MLVSLKDFFISYSRADRGWAEWIAWQLEADGYSVVIQAWDFRPGANFVLDMQKALAGAKRTIVVLSPNFLKTSFTQPEWVAAFSSDPRRDKQSALLPVRIQECDIEGLLGPITYIDLIGLNESAARERLLAGVSKSRTKPITAPKFPSITEASRFPGALPPIWNIPYPRNPFFTEREDVLIHLHNALHEGKTTALTQPQAISGLGGIGKTQIAVEYAYRYYHEYQAIFWVNAASRENLITDFVALAHLLNLPDKYEDQNQVITAVMRWLRASTDWLLIIDNADDLHMVADFIPSSNRGHILLTTRAHALGSIAYRVKIEKMGTEEGALLLLRRASILAYDDPFTAVSPTERAKAKEIVEVLDGLPLALAQAGAYIEETGCSLSDYLTLYQTRSADLLKGRGLRDFSYPGSVATTWSLSLQKVEQANPAAMELLRFCAFLAPDAIPEELIVEGADELGPVLRAVVTNPIELDYAIGELLKYSLVYRDPDNETLTMHRLVQAVLKDGMDEEALCQWSERTVQAVASVFPEVEVATWPRCQRLLSHAQTCMLLIDQWDIAFPTAAQLLCRAGIYLSNLAQYVEAEPLYQRALAIRERVLGAEHPDTAQSLNNLAELYHFQGRYDRVELLLQRAIAIHEKQLGLDNSETAKSFNSLGELYHAQAKYEQAEVIYQRTLMVREKILGAEHLDTAQSLNNLASLYTDLGRYTQAESLYQRALAIRERMLGPVHPDTAQSLNNLANFYQILAKYTQAESLYQRALAIREHMLGPEHPDTAQSLNNLAGFYRVVDQYERTEPLYQRALAIRERMLGPEHPDTAQSLNNLAELYSIQGKYQQAELFYRRALTIYGQVLGQEHPSVAQSLNSLAELYLDQNKYSEAEPLSLRALMVYEQVLGQIHPSIAATLNNLGELYRIQDKYEEAKPLYQRALTIYEEILGAEHPNTARILNNLALLYQSQGKYEQAEPLFQRALITWELVRALYRSSNEHSQEDLDLGAGYLDEGISLNNLGLLLLQMRKVAGARPYFEKMLNILTIPSASKYTYAINAREQQLAEQEVLEWLRTIIRDMETVLTSLSRLVHTTALSSVIGTISNIPPSLSSFSEAGKLLIKRITDRWRDVVTREASRIKKISILKRVRSPYVYTPPVTGKALVGRDDIFERISEEWARKGQRNSLLIHGHRRMGKTSVAQALSERCNLGEDSQLLYLSLEAVRSESELYQLLALRIWLLFREKLDKPGDNDFIGRNARVKFDFFFAVLNQVIGNTRLVLVLDEFEMLYKRLRSAKANDIIAYLRSQTVTYTWLALALVGLSDLYDLSLSYSSSLLGWESIRISFLDAKLAKYVLTNPSVDDDDDGFPLDYTPEALEMIVTLTHGQPYLIQVIGDRLVRRYNYVVFTEQRGHGETIDINDVQAVFEDPDFYATAAAYFNGVWLQATPDEMALLKALAEHETGLDEATLRASINLSNATFTYSLGTLKRHDVICCEGDRIYYAVPLMLRWVQNNHFRKLSKQ